MNNLYEIRKKRYYVYRKLGYDSKTASALSTRSLDVSGLEISKKTGKLKQNKTTKDFIATLDDRREKVYLDNYTKRIQDVKNDTVYTTHGMLTHDKRYKGETGKVVAIIKNQNKLSINQAYYFYYFMTRHNLSYRETKAQLLSNKDFEAYDRNKKGR